MKQKDFIILAILLLSPIIVNTILGIPAIWPVNGDTNSWLGFYGSYVGAIITMFILYRTRQWNKEDNDETRKMQHKILQYQAKKVEFEELKKQLDDNYRVLDFQSIEIVVNYIVLENYQIALAHLVQLNRNIEMQGYSFDLCLRGDEAEKEYVNCYNKLLKEYGMLVNDLIIICNIKNFIQYDGDYENYVRESYYMMNNIHNKNSFVEVSPFFEKINKMVCNKKTTNEIM